jgi:hypothetical protein
VIKKTEHMSVTNDEAVAMIASLYNGEKLVVNELEVIGDIKAGGNIIASGDGYFGPAYIGKHAKNDPNWAQFSHKDKTGENDYALIQQGSDGHTRLNGIENSTVAVGNSPKYTFTDIKTHIDEDIDNVKYNAPMALTNRITGNHSSYGQYIGLCGHVSAGACGYVGYNLITGNKATPPSNAKMSIEKV